jgi:hypothetical protein
MLRQRSAAASRVIADVFSIVDEMGFRQQLTVKTILYGAY